MTFEGLDGLFHFIRDITYKEGDLNTSLCKSVEGLTGKPGAGINMEMGLSLTLYLSHNAT